MPQKLTPEEQAILDKAIAELEADPMRCPTPLFMAEQRRKDAEKSGRDPYKLIALARAYGLVDEEKPK